MFNTLRVTLGDAPWNAKRLEKGHNRLVADLARGSQITPLPGQKDGPVRLSGHVSCALQPENGPIYRDVCYAQTSGKVDHPGFADLFRQSRDRLYIILGQFVRMFSACFGENLGLGRGGRAIPAGR